MHMPARQGGRAGPAQSLVEFALIAPLLVAIVIGIVELGILFSVYIGLTNSAREAARVGAIYRYPGPAPDTGALTNQGAIDAAVAPIDAGRLTAMRAAITITLNPIIRQDDLAPPVAVYPVTTTAANLLRAGEPLSLTLSYTHTLLWGMLGDNSLVLRAQASARIEPGGSP